ncbi:MAG: hypothetical protein M1469_04635 [Bacteroidetes bacterium]|nr:hypothetical protein [Bacteroidota bacterium]
MRYVKFAAFILMVVLTTVAMSQAQSMKGMHMMKMSDHAKTSTIQGEVVDLSCYLTAGQHGAKHAECARMCINSGLPVGILTKTGRVYLAIGPNREPANHLLVPYVAKQVKVIGQVNERGGIEVVSVQKVEPLSNK